MKYWVFLFMWINISILPAQEVRDFVEIRIRAGASIYGTTSIILLREGLIYNSYFDYNKGIRNEVKFVPYYLLDLDQVYVIQNYIYDFLRDSLWQVNIPNHIILGPHPIRVGILEIGKQEHTSFLYRYCNHPVDKLIMLMNSLIPARDRDAYGIPLKCQ